MPVPLDALADLPVKQYAELIGAAIGAAVAAFVIHRGRARGRSEETTDANMGRHGDRLVHIEAMVTEIYRAVVGGKDRGG